MHLARDEYLAVEFPRQIRIPGSNERDERRSVRQDDRELRRSRASRSGTLKCMGAWCFPAKIMNASIGMSHNTAARPRETLFSRKSSRARSLADSLDASAGFAPAASSNSAGMVI
jgi:hypothetical protein